MRLSTRPLPFLSALSGPSSTLFARSGFPDFRFTSFIEQSWLAGQYPEFWVYIFRHVNTAVGSALHTVKQQLLDSTIFAVRQMCDKHIVTKTPRATKKVLATLNSYLSLRQISIGQSLHSRPMFRWNVARAKNDEYSETKWHCHWDIIHCFD